MLYRDFATQEELDEQYDPERTVQNAGFYADLYERESDLIRSERNHNLRVPFGPTLAEHADIYPAGDNAPVLVYVHGGYWRARTSREFGFVARGPGSRGVATLVPNYELCPRVTIDEIVRQTRAALAWTTSPPRPLPSSSPTAGTRPPSSSASRRISWKRGGWKICPGNASFWPAKTTTTS